jgi:hypothetical protein
MTVKNIPQGASPLPIRGNLKPLYAASLAIAVVTAAVSAIGLLFPSAVYPTDELRRAFVPNDMVSFLIGLPILLGSMALTTRGKTAGLLLWPGALVFILYNYLIYIFCMPPHAGYLLYLALVVTSLYAAIGLMAALDAKAVQERLAGAVPAGLSGGVLAGLGALFLLRVVGIILAGNPENLPKTELAVNIADFLVSPAWIIGGVLLWQRKALGYTVGLGLLFSLSMLFVGLIAVMILQPVLTAAPFDLAGVLVVAVMGLVCFIPFALFLRGVLSGRKESSGRKLTP